MLRRNCYLSFAELRQTHESDNDWLAEKPNPTLWVGLQTAPYGRGWFKSSTEQIYKLGDLLSATNNEANRAKAGQEHGIRFRLWNSSNSCAW